MTPNTAALTVAIAHWLLNNAPTCEPVEGVTLSVSQDGYLTVTTPDGTEQFANVVELAEAAQRHLTTDTAMMNAARVILTAHHNTTKEN